VNHITISDAFRRRINITDRKGKREKEDSRILRVGPGHLRCFLDRKKEKKKKKKRGQTSKTQLSYLAAE